MLALSFAGLCAGRLDCFVNDLGVTLGGDFLLLNENLITDRAMLALSFAGFRAGRLDCFVNDLGVCSLLNRFVRPPYLGLTNRAIHDLIVAAFFCASGSDFIFPDCFPGSVPLGRDLLRLGRITDAAGEGPHAGDCAGCGGGDSAVVPGVILGFGDRCSGCDLLSTALAIGIAGIALLSAGGRLGITNLGLSVHARRCTAPNAVYIVDRSPGCRTNRLLITAVPIAQLGRGDGDVIIC